MGQVVMQRDDAQAEQPSPASRSALNERLSQRARALIAGIVAAALLVVAIALGSRGFHWFDAGLIGYAVATIFALAAVAYKYTFWLMRPQTGRYFWRSWRLFFSYENFKRYTAVIPMALFADLLTQQFIRKRGFYRWVTHQLIFWGVVLSCLITFPLTFGWLRFTQEYNGQYRLWALGFGLFSFAPDSVFGFFVYHALVFTAILLLIGVILAFHRRFHDLAQIAIQRFRYDLVPLALLFAIAISGLALTADSAFLNGAFYWFISLTHEAIVVLWLISLPFGKFFHILERPATIGIELYWRTGEDDTQHTCPRCGTRFAPARFIGDLKKTLYAIGEDYAVQNAPQTSQAAISESEHPQAAATAGMWWQDFCPECKRIMRAQANMNALGRNGNQFL